MNLPQTVAPQHGAWIIEKTINTQHGVGVVGNAEIGRENMPSAGRYVLHNASPLTLLIGTTCVSLMWVKVFIPNQLISVFDESVQVGTRLGR